MPSLHRSYFLRVPQVGFKKRFSQAHGSHARSGSVLRYRMAKADRPWWLPYVSIGGVIIALNIGYLSYSHFCQWRNTRHLEKKEALLVEDMRRVMQGNPELAAASVQMVCHYLWSQSTTPFGSPMVSSADYRDEAMQLKALVKQWRREYPELCSVADLWALVCTAGLAALGGPPLPPTLGREDILEENRYMVNSKADPKGDTVDSSLRVTPSTFERTCRDARDIQRLLANEGLSLDQIVALFGLSRFTGFHSYQPTAYDNVDEKGVNWFVPSNQKNVVLSDSRRPSLYRCSSTPFRYSNEYFRLLLNSHWEPVKSLEKKDLSSPQSTSPSFQASYYYCRPEECESSAACHNGRISAFSSNKSAEATVIPVSLLDRESDCSKDVTVSVLDISFLKDVGTRAIVKRFANDERLLDYVVKNLFVDILQRGHNTNLIYELSS